MRTPHTRREALPPVDPRQRYTLDEAAEYLRVSKTRLYEYMRAKTIAVIVDGKRTYVPGAEIERLSQPPPPPSPPSS